MPHLSYLLRKAGLCALVLSLHAQGTVVYLTDLEGSRAKLQTFYRNSGAFGLEDSGQPRLKPGFILVYGGDATDRYYGSRFVVRELNRHKREFPDRVFLIVGNRDLKALRIRPELSLAALKKPPLWMPWLAEDEWMQEASLTPNLVRRLKFLLAKTMGSPAAFELRRAELVSERKTPQSDDDVAQSFIDEMRPGGDLLTLLQNMQLTWRMGNTLIVHGGLTPLNIQTLPYSSKRPLRLDDWQRELDAWYRRELSAHLSESVAWSGEGARPAEALLNYPIPGVREKSNPHSVITGRHVDDQNNPLLPHPKVIQWLLSEGVHRLIVGHTPIGDAPITVRTADGAFEVLFADNSYTQNESNAAWITLTGPNLETAQAHGLVRLGHDWQPLNSRTEVGKPSVVGRLLSDGSRVIGQTAEGRLVSTRMHRFEVLNAILDPAEVPPRIVADPVPAPSPLPDGPIGFFPGSFDFSTPAHKAIALEAIQRFKLKKLFIVANIFGPKDYEASVVERIDMLKILFEGYEDTIEIRGEPFEGKEAFFSAIQTVATGPLYNIVGDEGADALPPGLFGKRDRTWVVVPREGNPSASDPSIVILPIPEEYRQISSTSWRAALRAGRKPEGMDTKQYDFIRQNHLYESFENPELLSKEYETLFDDFQTDLRRHLPTVGLKVLKSPPFKANQSKGSWLEKFIVWTIQQNALNAPDATTVADTARFLFAQRGWESRFPIVKLKSGVPSERCLRYLRGEIP